MWAYLVLGSYFIGQLPAGSPCEWAQAALRNPAAGTKSR